MKFLYLIRSDLIAGISLFLLTQKLQQWPHWPCFAMHDVTAYRFCLLKTKSFVSLVKMTLEALMFLVSQSVYNISKTSGLLRKDVSRTNNEQNHFKEIQFQVLISTKILYLSIVWFNAPSARRFLTKSSCYFICSDLHSGKNQYWWQRSHRYHIKSIFSVACIICLFEKRIEA